MIRGCTCCVWRPKGVSAKFLKPAKRQEIQRRKNGGMDGVGIFLTNKWVNIKSRIGNRISKLR